MKKEIKISLPVSFGSVNGLGGVAAPRSGRAALGGLRPPRACKVLPPQFFSASGKRQPFRQEYSRAPGPGR
jgi:hypothetical protein